MDVVSQGSQLLAGVRLGLRYLRRWGRGPTSGRNWRLDDLVRLMHEAGFVVKDETLIGTTIKAAGLIGFKQAAPTTGM